jgi:hypothetical protein
MPPVVWIAIASGVAKLTHLPQILFTDERIIVPVLRGAAVCLGISAVLVLYLSAYLPRVRGLKDSSAWDVYCPRAVPALALSSAVGGSLLIRATWPVWGVLAPLIWGTEFFGLLFSLHFVPWII